MQQSVAATYSNRHRHTVGQGPSKGSYGALTPSVVTVLGCGNSNNNDRAIDMKQFPDDNGSSLYKIPVLRLSKKFKNLIIKKII